MNGNGLSRQAISGTFWAYLSFVFGKLFTFASTVILARMLVPAEFGVMGYCMIAIQYLDILCTFGLDAALIARRDRLEEAANANFVIGIGTGILLYGVAWLIAPFVAVFFDEPSIVPLLRTLALVLPISALGIVPGAMIQRELRFRAKLIPDIIRNLSKGLVSIGLAYYGFGVWSLVIGQIVGELVTTTLLWPLAHWYPTWKFDREVFRENLVFGANILLVGIFGALLTNVDYLLVGRSLGAAALGFYTLGYRLPDLLIQNSNIVIARVGFPVFAQIQQDREQLVRWYLKYINYLSLFTFPLGIGLAAISEPFILTIYTSTWASAIPAMQLISIALAISSIGAVPGVLYKAIGKPEILNKLALIKVPFAITILWLGTHWGIVGVAFAQIGVAICNVTLDCAMVSRVIRVSFAQILAAIRPALIGALGMGVVLLAINIWVEPTGLPGIAILVASGVITFLSILYSTSRETILDATQLLSTFLVKAQRKSS